MVLSQLPLFSFKTQILPHQDDAPILEVNKLSVVFDTQPALQDVSFTLGQGERVAVVGPNGSGKSTLLKTIAGVTEPTTGEVKIGGHQPGGHICIAYVPQRSQIDWAFPARVIDVVMMGRIGKLGLLRHPHAHDWEFANQCLAEVDLAELAKRQIGQLSGGQQQRMFIARALAQEAELMLMDEPLTGLDLTSELDIFTILDELRRKQVTVMVATHELDIAAAHFDQVILLNSQLVGIGKPEAVFTPEKLKDAYGGHFHLPGRLCPSYGEFVTRTGGAGLSDPAKRPDLE